MLPVVFILIPTLLYISATRSWDYLKLVIVLVILTYLYSKKKALAIQTPASYYYLVIFSCVPTILAVIGFDVAALYEVIKGRYFAQLGLGFAITGTVIIGGLMAFILTNLKNKLTPARQVLVQVLVMVNFYVVAIGLGTAGSDESFSKALPFLPGAAQFFAYVAIAAGTSMAIWNIILARAYNTART